MYIYFSESSFNHRVGLIANLLYDTINKGLDAKSMIAYFHFVKGSVEGWKTRLRC